MTPQEAVLVRDILLGEIEAEHKATRRVLAAVPNDKGDYAPDARSMPALKLAFHIVESEIHLLTSIGKRDFSQAAPPEIPAEIQTPADVAAMYDARYPEAVAQVKAMSAEDLAAPLNFYGFVELPAVQFLGYPLRHTLHHRGQLSAYLRPMGGMVPAIFGPSADEDWKPGY